MSNVKRLLQREALAKPQPLIREIIVKGRILASAKDQFMQMREAAQNEADGNQ